MTIINYKENVIKFILCIVVVLLVMIVLSKAFNKPVTQTETNDVTTSVIEFEDDKTNIYVEYPRFYSNDEINQVINDTLYNYIKEFRASENLKLLDISYEIKKIFNYVNVEFTIQNSSNFINNMNLLFDLENKTQLNISNIFDKSLLENEIFTLASNKYPTDVYLLIANADVNDFTYIFNDKEINVYFNNIDLTGLETVPNVTISLYNPVNDIVDSPNIKKYIAFTYDDGPSQYTKDIVNTLMDNDSTATFFMFGNKMNNNDDIILQVLSSGSEIGTNGYESKNYLFNTIDEIKDDLNKTNEIFNSITKKNISLFRPSFGKYNGDMLNLKYKLVLWNIDSKDWLLKDENAITENVLSSACDGCIVRFYDTFDYSCNATKKILPELKKMGYEVVSVSKLLEIKNYKYKNEAIDYIK